jgi:peptide deformylase
MRFLLLLLGIYCLHAEKQNSNIATDSASSAAALSHDTNSLSSIRTIGDPILQTPTRKLTVEEIQSDTSVKEASEFGHRMLSEFRAQKGFGRAIAAPQFGYGIAMICLFIHGQKMTIYNPEIIYKSPETFLMWDDCLSFPDQMACVRRHKSISVAFMDERGAGRTWINLPKDLAELLQHEIDHLNGVVALDIAEEPPSAKNEACSGSNDTGEDSMLCNVSKVVPRSAYVMQREKYDSYLI